MCGIEAGVWLRATEMEISADPWAHVADPWAHVAAPWALVAWERLSIFTFKIYRVRCMCIFDVEKLCPLRIAQRYLQAGCCRRRLKLGYNLSGLILLLLYFCSVSYTHLTLPTILRV